MISARASQLLSVAEVGQTVPLRLLVQGKTPFRILRVRCGDERFKFAVPEREKNLHLIAIEFTAGETPGKVSESIRIETNQAGGKVLEVPVQIRVMPRGPVTF